MCGLTLKNILINSKLITDELIPAISNILKKKKINYKSNNDGELIIIKDENIDNKKDLKKILDKEMSKHKEKLYDYYKIGIDISETKKKIYIRQKFK